MKRFKERIKKAGGTGDISSLDIPYAFREITGALHVLGKYCDDLFKKLDSLEKKLKDQIECLQSDADCRRDNYTALREDDTKMRRHIETLEKKIEAMEKVVRGSQAYPIPATGIMPLVGSAQCICNTTAAKMCPQHKFN